MINRKGLTLIELLTVIVIMATLLLIVLPNVMVVSEKIEEEHYEQTVKLLENAVLTYIDKYDNSGLNRIGATKDITMKELAEAGLIKIPFINPRTGEALNIETSIVRVTRRDVNEYEIIPPFSP